MGSIESAQALVAPLAGARIETEDVSGIHEVLLSPPSRGRGLKLHQVVDRADILQVAPLAGARIETGGVGLLRSCAGRPPRGGAD